MANRTIRVLCFVANRRKTGSKRGKPGPSRSHGLPKSAPTGPPLPTHGLGPSDLTPSELWGSLRQGARNVAGVRYQLAVTAHLLAESRAGVLPFVELVPEGYEDIDCLDRDELRWLVQAKEVGAGAGRFTAGSVAEVIAHAAPAAHGETRIVAVTDAQLGGQIVETGWTRSIADTPGFDIGSVVNGVVTRGLTRSDAEALVARSHVVRLPWNTAPLTTLSIAGTYTVAPAVAAIATSRLLEDLGTVAADQRQAEVDRPGRRVLNDLDALVARVVSVVDVDSLDTAVRLGVCEIADYAVAPGASHADFLLGLDAAPAHIGAHYDIIRPGPSRATQVALEEARYALIAGASGSGKSAQMWRSARDVAPGARVVRVHRLETDADVRELDRFVQLLSPSDASAVVVCCDDLGRPRTSMWPVAARRLLEQASVLLLGAVRHEDFTAELLRHGGELVELSLDDDTALAIADQVSYAGISLALETSEAVRSADGHLMEYIALLTTGKRMRAVLAAQVEALLRLDEDAAARVTRLVCAAHVLGVGVAGEAVAEGTDLDVHRAAQALRRLQDEHIVTSEDQTTWRGLHQRRSDVLTDLLHETPPPTLHATMTTAVGVVAPAALGWCLRRLVELFPLLPSLDPELVRAAVMECSSAAETAALLEGLERADHSVTAREYLPILERHRRPRVPVLDMALLVLGEKLAGVRFGEDGGNSLVDNMGRHLHQCAEALPNRSTTYSDAAGAAITEDRLSELVSTAELEDAVRLLEAAASHVRLSGRSLGRIAAAFPWPEGTVEPVTRRLHARLIAACWLACSTEHDFHAVFGGPSDRLLRAVGADPDIVSASLPPAQALEATVQLLANPMDDRQSASFDWDLESRARDTGDVTNRVAVEVATFIGECCPELEIVEVVTVIADGSRFRLGDFEPGHKRLGRNARPSRELVRVNVGIQAAISRQVAAHSWTELVRLRSRAAVLLAGLAREGPRRLNGTDNPRRRIEWLSQLEVVEDLLVQLPRPPVVSELDMGTPAVIWDAQREDEPVSAGLRRAAAVLRMLVPEGAGQLVAVGAGEQARQAAERVEAAAGDAIELTTAVERSALVDLAEHLRRLGDVLVAMSFDPTITSRLRGSPNDFAIVVASEVQGAARRQLEGERSTLEDVFGRVPGAAVLELPDRAPFMTSIAGHQWLITVPPESWDEATRLAANLEERLVDVPVSIVCEVDRSLLPVAVRLSHSFGSGLLPVPPETVAEFASMMDRSTVSGPSIELVSAVTGELLMASWYQSRSDLRNASWPDPGGSPHTHLQNAEETVGDLESTHPELAEPLRALTDRVAAEVRGVRGERTVAAELSGADVFDAVDLPESHAITLVSRGILAALDVEFQRATTE